MPVAATDATCSTAPNRGLIRWDYCHLFYQAKSRKPPCGEIAPPGGANMHQNNAQPRSLPNMLRPHHSPTANQFSRPQDKADLTGTCTATMHLSITVPAHYAKPHVHALPAAAATAIKGGGATAVPVPLPTRLSTKSQQTAANGPQPASPIYLTAHDTDDLHGSSQLYCCYQIYGPTAAKWQPPQSGLTGPYKRTCSLGIVVCKLPYLRY